MNGTVQPPPQRPKKKKRVKARIADAADGVDEPGQSRVGDVRRDTVGESCFLFKICGSAENSEFAAKRQLIFNTY